MILLLRRAARWPLVSLGRSRRRVLDTWQEKYPRDTAAYLRASANDTASSISRMPRRTARARARASARASVLAGLYAALGIANSVAAAKRYRAAEWATKPLLMPVLAAFALAAGRETDRETDMRLPAAGLALSGLGDTALLRAESSEGWFVPGMGTYAAAQFLLAAGFLRPQRDTASPR